jgi:hypothetical protein
MPWSGRHRLSARRAAVFAPSAAAARRWIARGVGLVAVSEDTATIAAAFRDVGTRRTWKGRDLKGGSPRAATRTRATLSRAW